MQQGILAGLNLADFAGPEQKDRANGMLVAVTEKRTEGRDRSLRRGFRPSA